MPEIKHHCSAAPFILVGTKCDLRNDPEIASKVSQILTTADGEKLAKEVGAVQYKECSALTQDGLKEVFDHAIRAALDADKPQKKPIRCQIL